MTKATIMITAWKIARQGQERFGGSVKQYFACALRIAWRESTMAPITERIGELEMLGFKRWTKGSMDRMYINASALGLVCTYYKTGNISSAAFNGYPISNSEAGRMRYAKTYIDLVKHCIVSDNLNLMEAACKLIHVEYDGRSHIVNLAA